MPLKSWKNKHKDIITSNEVDFLTNSDVKIERLGCFVNRVIVAITSSSFAFFFFFTFFDKCIFAVIV